MNKNEMITRDFNAIIETRSDNESGKKIITGLIPYNSKSENMGGFIETIAPTAFNKTLSDKADVRCLIDHANDKIIGRVKNSTLVLENTADGLRFEVALSNTSYANDLYENVLTGNISSVSFGFKAIKDTFDYNVSPAVRNLNEVKLIEISFVVFPAYTETSISVRSAVWEKRNIDITALEAILEKQESGNSVIDDTEKLILVSAIEKLNELIKTEPVAEEKVAEPVEETIPEIEPDYYSELKKAL